MTTQQPPYTNKQLFEMTSSRMKNRVLLVWMYVVLFSYSVRIIGGVVRILDSVCLGLFVVAERAMRAKPTWKLGFVRILDLFVRIQFF